MPKTLVDALCGRALCSACDLVNLNVSRYCRYAFSRARIDLSAQRSVLDIDGFLT